MNAVGRVAGAHALTQDFASQSWVKPDAARRSAVDESVRNLVAGLLGLAAWAERDGFTFIQRGDVVADQFWR